jgi:hypothetical protein
LTPKRRPAVASARPWLPADAVVTPVIDGLASFSRATAFAAPRILNEPVACTVSSLSHTSAPVIRDSQTDGTSGVRHADPTMRRAAAATSGSSTARGMPE